MKVIKAKTVDKYDHFTVMIYGAPGTGKTSMLKSLEGRTLVFSIDGMYQVLSGQENVDIVVMDASKTDSELNSFFKFARDNVSKYDNFIIDNLTTFEQMWLNHAANKSGFGMPEQKDYAIIVREVFDFVRYMKGLNKNLIIFAHEDRFEVTKSNGGTYTRFEPNIRHNQKLMGIVSLVGRLVAYDDKEGNHRRKIVLQPTENTLVKDQLIGNLKTIEQMELFPLLQNKNNKKEEVN